jgi:hypothetical protein
MHKNWRGFPTTGCKPVGYENSGADAGQVRLLPKPPYSFTRSCESRHILRAITLMDQLLSARMTGTARWIYQGAVLLCLAGRRGFEPWLRSSKPRVLPLDDLPKFKGTWLELVYTVDLKSNACVFESRRPHHITIDPSINRV